MQLLALLFVLHAGEFDRDGTLLTEKLSATYAKTPVLVLTQIYEKKSQCSSYSANRSLNTTIALRPTSPIRQRSPSRKASSG